MTKRLKWADINGRLHPQHVVRSLGAGRGFGVLHILSNSLVSAPQATREQAWECLREMEAKLTAE